MRSLDNQIEYWDSVSSSKSFTYPIDIDRFSSFVSPGATILDYGCGYGRTCDELYRLGFRNVVGIDSITNDDRTWLQRISASQSPNIKKQQYLL